MNWTEIYENKICAKKKQLQKQLNIEIAKKKLFDRNIAIKANKIRTWQIISMKNTHIYIIFS